MSVKLAVQTVFNALDHVTGPMATMAKNGERYKRAMQRHGMDIGASWGKLRGIIGGAAAALTTGLAAKAIIGFAEKGDEIGRMSRTLGLSAQSFQELGIAAKMADLSSEDLSAAFKKMNNNMGQLRTGTGSLFTYLKATNPQLALQLKHTRNSETAFTLLMEAIDKEGNVAKRAALSQAAFGKSGQALIEMSHGLEEARRKAREGGGIISDADVKAAEDFDTGIKLLKVSLTGFFNVIMGRAMKVLGPYLEKLNAWIAANRELITQKLRETVDGIVNAVKKAYDIWKKWHPVIIGVVATMILFNNAMRIAAIISVVSKAIAIAAAMMDMFAAGASLATVAQWGLNAAMDANPVGLVILGLAAMATALYLIIRYHKEIVEGLRQAWNWFNKLFNNPAIKLALYAFAAPLAIIASFIKTIVDLLNGEGWKSFVNLAGPWKALTDVLGLTKGGGGIGQGMTSPGGSGVGGERTGVSPNLGMISSSTTNRSILDVNFAQMAGMSMKQTGAAPGINVNLGPTLAGSP